MAGFHRDESRRRGSQELRTKFEASKLSSFPFGVPAGCPTDALDPSNNHRKRDQSVH